MYHASTPLNPSTLEPLRRSSIGYRYRAGRTGLTTAAAVLLLTALAFVVGFAI